MHDRARTRLVPLTLLLALAAAGCSNSSSGGSPSCDVAAPAALRACVADVGAAVEGCYAGSDAPCAADDRGVAQALANLELSVRASCDDGAFGDLSTDALAGRLRNSCSSEAASLAWRTYGGPQGAVWPQADATARECLTAAHEAASQLVDDTLAVVDDCLESGGCDDAGLAAARQPLVEAAQGTVDGACADLSGLIAVDSATYVARAAHQGELPCGRGARGHRRRRPRLRAVERRVRCAARHLDAHPGRSRALGRAVRRRQRLLVLDAARARRASVSTGW